MNEINLKLLLIGDSTVGKTSILFRYINEEFPEYYVSTIGVEYKIKTLIIDGKKVILRIWDTSGQERYRSITQNFYRNANGILFVFDITNRESFNNIKIWLTDSENCETKVTKILVGNKIDLKDKRTVDKEIIEAFAEKKDMKYFESSAKEGINIDELFRELAELILKDKTEEEINEEYTNNNNYSLSILKNSKQESEKKKPCC